MPTNATVFPVNGPAVLYFQDGSVITVDTQERKDFQVIKGGFCTISDPPEGVDAESGEHPPPGYAFAEKMIAFWEGMKAKLEESQQPEVNPL